MIEMFPLFFRNSRIAGLAVCFSLSACGENLKTVSEGTIAVPSHDLYLELYRDSQWEVSAGVDAVVLIGEKTIGTIPAFAFFTPTDQSIREIDLSLYIIEESPGIVFGLVDGYPTFLIDINRNIVYPNQTGARDTSSEALLKNARGLMNLKLIKLTWIR